MTTQQNWLNNYFGDEVADDLEKTAQARLLTKLAENAGIDINSLSEEQIQALALHLMQELEAEQGGGVDPSQGQPGIPQQGAAPQNPLAQFGQPTQQQMPQQGQPGLGGMSPETAMAKEAAAKFEEADMLGRVMAHSYVEELDKIASARGVEKTAANAFDVGGLRAGGTARSLGERARSAALKYKMKGRAFVEDNPKKMTAAAAAGGALVGARAGKRKEASAFEKLANDRALEILQTLGIDPSTGQPVQQQEPDLDQAVDQRALQLLAEAGYDPNAVASAYDQTVGDVGGGNPGGQGGYPQQ